MRSIHGLPSRGTVGVERGGLWGGIPERKGIRSRRHQSLRSLADRERAAMKYNPSVTSSRRKNRKVR